MCRAIENRPEYSQPFLMIRSRSRTTQNPSSPMVRKPRNSCTFFTPYEVPGCGAQFSARPDAGVAAPSLTIRDGRVQKFERGLR